MTCRNSSALSTRFPDLSISSTRPADLSISSRDFDAFAKHVDPIDTHRPRLVAERHAEFAESAKLEQAINVSCEALAKWEANLRGLGYGG